MTRKNRKPRLKLLTVTPEMAAEWLACNTNNRSMRKMRVASLVRSMKSGEWRQGHPSSTILVGRDGTLYDGQHRLAALVEFGKPLDFYVCHDAVLEDQFYTDLNAARTAADMLKMLGYPQYASLAGACKIIDRLQRRQSIQLQNWEVVRVAELYARQVYAVHFPRKAYRVMASSVIRGCLACVRGIDDEHELLVDEFVQAVMAPRKQNAPPTKLFEYMISDVRVGSGGSGPRSEIILRTFNCLFRFKLGESITRLFASRVGLDHFQSFLDDERETYLKEVAGKGKRRQKFARWNGE